LADRLVGQQLKNVVVLGIPRGGVVVASQVAGKLRVPLDIIITRKLLAPGNSELAIGAVGGTSKSQYLNQYLIRQLQVTKDYLTAEVARQQEEIKRREALYRQGRSALLLTGKTVVLVDDGAATGATLIAACRQIWQRQPKKVIIALPTAGADTVKQLEEEADEVQVVETPESFFSVSQVYEEFGQTTDEEVIKILNNQEK